MKKISLLFVLLCCSPLLRAQFHDAYWLFGSGGGNPNPVSEYYGITTLDFNTGNRPEVTKHLDYTCNFTTTNASMCDSSGVLQCYTNGDNVYDASHQIMLNGANIHPNDGYGSALPQGALILPFPEHPGQYILVTIERFPSDFYGRKLFYHRIDMNENNGLGKVVERRKLLVQDSLTGGGLSAVKHANGRDWWFFVWREEDKVVYSGLLSPAGIDIDTQTVDKKINMFGQVTITPDGTKIIRADHRFIGDPGSINIFDLDRCLGRISNQQTYIMQDGLTQGFIGAAVSLDSRYLYVSHAIYIFQYDLQSADIFASENLVGQWDSTYYSFWPTIAWLAQAGPDGRIYVNTSGGSMSMHYINFPNRPGEACQFINNGVQMPTVIKREIPNFPNYRLGPLDGSPCDTLGLDNHPLARFRWDIEDTLLAPLTLTFSDLSNYEPSLWHWDFGDGTTHDTTATGEVIHAFPAPGTYHVCLIVSNQYSTDTLCQSLTIGPVSATDSPNDRVLGVKVYPNPANDYLLFYAEGITHTSARLELINAYGVPVLMSNIGLNEVKYISTAHLPTGIYYYRVMSAASGQLRSGKVIIAH